MSDDDFATPPEGSPTWIAELRRRCPTPEETDALCDRAERLAAIERGVRELADEMDYGEGSPEIVAKCDYVVSRLRAILDPPEGS